MHLQLSEMQMHKCTRDPIGTRARPVPKPASRFKMVDEVLQNAAIQTIEHKRENYNLYEKHSLTDILDGSSLEKSQIENQIEVPL